MPAIAYFITFSTYGARLHGDERGSVDRRHNRPGDPLLDPDEGLVKYCQRLMSQPPYSLDHPRREIVLSAIVQHAEFRRWSLFAAHVRTWHVHTVVVGDATPERMMDEFKAYASRALNRAKLDPDGRHRWSRHGSTRWLDTPESVQGAARYTIDEQGERMAVYEASFPETNGEPRPQGSGLTGEVRVPGRD